MFQQRRNTVGEVQTKTKNKNLLATELINLEESESESVKEYK